MGSIKLKFYISKVMLAFVLLFSADVAAQSSGKTIVFFGDSLTAGLGLEPSSAYPALVEEMAANEGIALNAVNAGVSGETTAGGLRRVEWVLKRPTDIFVIALGANDGLRGVDPKVTRANVKGIIHKIRKISPTTKIVLAGMLMPPNFGEAYASDFRAVFIDVSKEERVPFIPFLLDGVAGEKHLNQADGIHPNEKGQKVIAELVWKYLKEIVKSS